MTMFRGLRLRLRPGVPVALGAERDHYRSALELIAAMCPDSVSRSVAQMALDRKMTSMRCARCGRGHLNGPDVATPLCEGCFDAVVGGGEEAT